MKIFTMLLSIVILSSCASYKTSFSCGDAEGASCISMDRVDLMIQNGEIERFNEQTLKDREKPSKKDISKNNQDAPLPILKGNNYD